MSKIIPLNKDQKAEEIPPLTVETAEAVVKNIKRLDELLNNPVATQQNDAEVANLKGAVNTFISVYGIQLLWGWLGYQREFLPLANALFPVVGRIVGELGRKFDEQADGETTTYEDQAQQEAKD